MADEKPRSSTPATQKATRKRHNTTKKEGRGLTFIVNNTIGIAFLVMLALTFVVHELRLRREITEYNSSSHAAGLVVLPNGTRAAGTLNQSNGTTSASTASQ